MCVFLTAFCFYLLDSICPRQYFVELILMIDINVTLLIIEIHVGYVGLFNTNKLDYKQCFLMQTTWVHGEYMFLYPLTQVIQQ